MAALAALRLREPGDAADAGDEAAGEDQPGRVERAPQAAGARTLAPPKKRAEQSRHQHTAEHSRAHSALFCEAATEQSVREEIAAAESQARPLRSRRKREVKATNCAEPSRGAQRGLGPLPERLARPKGPEVAKTPRVERSGASRLFSFRDAKQTRR